MFDCWFERRVDAPDKSRREGAGPLVLPQERKQAPIIVEQHKLTCLSVGPKWALAQVVGSVVCAHLS